MTFNFKTLCSVGALCFLSQYAGAEGNDNVDSVEKRGEISTSVEKAENKASSSENKKGISLMEVNEIKKGVNLIKAIKNNKKAKINKLIDEIKDVDRVRDSDNGNTALLTAVALNRVNVVEQLIKKGANLNVSNSEGFTPLIGAIINGSTRDESLKLVKLLLHQKNEHGLPKVNINAKTKVGNTALTLASIRGYKRVIESLIKKGADINLVDKHGNTPLSIAAYYGYAGVVELLLKNKAKVDLSSRNAKAILKKARRYNKIVDLFKDRGIDLEKLVDKDKNIEKEPSQTSESNSLQNDKDEDEVADINSVDKYGNTPLSIAAYYGYARVVELLLKNREKVVLSSRNAKAILKKARRYNKIVDLFKDRGVDLEKLVDKDKNIEKEPSQTSESNSLQNNLEKLVDKDKNIEKELSQTSKNDGLQNDEDEDEDDFI